MSLLTDAVGYRGGPVAPTHALRDGVVSSVRQAVARLTRCVDAGTERHIGRVDVVHHQRVTRHGCGAERAQRASFCSEGYSAGAKLLIDVTARVKPCRGLFSNNTTGLPKKHVIM